MAGNGPSTGAPAITTRYPSARRVVAIGDVHGDLKATHAALRLGGLIDDGGHWAGGDTVVVQTGDVLDRGDDEQAILDLLMSLQAEAKKAGGAVHLLQGNHELMNAAGDFRYVTPGGWEDFRDAPGVDESDPRVARYPPDHRARAAAFLPGGSYAKRIATHPVVVIVGDTVFAHGGVTPTYAGDIERINSEVASWLLGGPPKGAQIVMKPDSPVWSRHFSDDTDADDCTMLDESLDEMKAKRMVVGHTVQRKINAACDDKVWRIDVGMASHYGGTPQALELVDGEVRILD
ncbi:MAG TPA: calcineurin [Polyangiaceae bacterium]|nr:calcineurin [Polyangiaceae bacterium]